MKKQYTFSKTLTDKEYLEHLRTTYIEDGVLEAHRWSDLILLELAEEALEQLQKFKSRIRPLKHEWVCFMVRANNDNNNNNNNFNIEGKSVLQRLLRVAQEIWDFDVIVAVWYY